MALKASSPAPPLIKQKAGSVRRVHNQLKFLVASTTLPLALGWGWNISLYLGMLFGLLTLMILLLWMLMKQLRNSVSKTLLQPVRSFRQPCFDQRLQHVL
ncbi:hypothetical protein WMY93_009093 [Mugilogobius chulae]|uniref:Uncharacterized protein n=1 Tax=Mugilogobius chulae TaxID=88201 RepID=A0AAW0PBT4_9GOBI